MVKRLSRTKPIIVMLPILATSIPEEAGAAFEMMMGMPTLITLISMSAGILPLYEMLYGAQWQVKHAPVIICVIQHVNASYLIRPSDK